MCTEGATWSLASSSTLTWGGKSGALIFIAEHRSSVTMFATNSPPVPDVVGRVLHCSTLVLADADNDMDRIGAHGVEETEVRQVHRAFGVQAGYPGDGPRHDEIGEQLVVGGGALQRRVDLHGALRKRVDNRRRPGTGDGFLPFPSVVGLTKPPARSGSRCLRGGRSRRRDRRSAPAALAHCGRRRWRGIRSGSCAPRRARCSSRS